MRLQLFLNLLLQTAAAAATEMADTASSHRELEWQMEYDPDINIVYDAPNYAQCPGGTGRRYDSYFYNDLTNCPSGTGYQLEFSLMDGGPYNVTWYVCPMDHYLKIESTREPLCLGSGDKNFVCNLCGEIGNTTAARTNKYSIEALSANANGLMCDWPCGLNASFILDKEDEFASQRYYTLVFDPNPMSQIFLVNPPENYTYDILYQSLCTNLDQNKHLATYGGEMLITISTDPPCSPVSNNMDEMSPMEVGAMWGVETCQVPMSHSTDPANINVANGNCYGRCGSGCGDLDPSTNKPLKSQYTVDCADYDTCMRFNISRWGSYNCHEEFRHLLDDAMFSGHCFNGTEVQPPDECDTGGVDYTVAPTDAPVTASPTPAPLSTLAPSATPSGSPTATPVTIAPTMFPRRIVLTRTLVGQNCNNACNWVADMGPMGIMESRCTTESLFENNFRWDEDNLYANAASLNVICANITGPDSVDTTAKAYPVLPSATCVATDNPRDESTIDCAASEPGAVRFCTCYEQRRLY